MIRILLVDDQNIVRQGLQALLEPKPELQVVGTAEDGKSALEQVEQLQPDLVLIDIEMPRMNGVTATEKICQLVPTTKVIVLTSYEEEQYVAQALQAGAKGYLLKHTLAEDLEKAIWSVYHGYSQVESKLLEKIIAQSSTSKSATSKHNEHTVAQDRVKAETLSGLQKDGEPEKLSGNNLTTTFNNSKNSQNYSLKNTLLSGESSRAQLTPTQENLSKKAVLWDTNLETVNLDNSALKTVKEKPSVPEKYQSQPEAVKKSKKWLIVGSVVTIALLTMGITWISFFNRRNSQPISAPTSVSVPAPVIETVSGLGRIEPQGKAISLSAPTSLEAAKLEQLLVKEGDRVKQGQIIGILDGRQRQQAVLEEAKTHVAIAQARLEQVKAGAKRGAILAKQAAIANLQEELAGEIQTQQATIAKFTAELDNAQTQLRRHQQLYENGAISASELDNKSLSLKTARERLNEAQNTLKRTQRTLKARLQEAQANLEETNEVRPVDIQIAQAQLQQARAAVAKAESNMELAYVRAPMNGEILAIHTRPGEALSDEGIVQLGQTDQMIVTAEIDQNDINRVKIGQKATIYSGIFSEKLQGRVHQIGSLIGKNDILNTDPAAKEDTRVVEVEILLDSQDSKRVAKLTNLEVDVTIKL